MLKKIGMNEWIYNQSCQPENNVSFITFTRPDYVRILYSK